MLTLICLVYCYFSLDRDRADQIAEARCSGPGVGLCRVLGSHPTSPIRPRCCGGTSYDHRTTSLTATFINRNTAAVYFAARARLIWQLIVLE